MQRVTKTLIGIAMATASVAAMGQTYRATGRGDFSRGDDKRRILEASASFTRSTFSLSISLAGGRRAVIEGTTSDSDRRRGVRVTSFDGLRVDNGIGYIEVEDGALKSFDIEGGSRVDRFRAKFTADRRGDRGDGRPEEREPGGNTTGKGTIRRGDDRDDLKKVTFNLDRDGRFKITLEGRDMRDVVLRGRWNGRGDTRSLTLDGEVNGRDVSGDGTIRLSDDRKEVRALNLNGRIGRERLTIEFRDR